MKEDRQQRERAFCPGLSILSIILQYIAVHRALTWRVVSFATSSSDETRVWNGGIRGRFFGKTSSTTTVDRKTTNISGLN